MADLTPLTPYYQPRFSGALESKVMERSRLQDEHDKTVRGCDIFVCLFFIKTGRFTEKEFDSTYRRFKEKGLPDIFTFFNNADAKVGDLKEEDLTSFGLSKKADPARALPHNVHPYRRP